MDDKHRAALDQRQRLIEHRAREVARSAMHDRTPWIQALGPHHATSTAEPTGSAKC